MIDKLVLLSEAKDILLEKRAKKKKVVFTNGCFDILHVGHVNYLQQAKELGDFLVIGLNSDKSVKKLKGPERPINSEKDRALVLSCLEMVDLVVIFEEDTPIETLEILKPSIHVKGGDYVAEELPEYKTVTNNGGKVEIVKFVAGYSTTSVIDRLNS
jgi:D-glycero-beta-D-manno-heptose 1-phosphate adenylyltransferase